tara:strand:+ start:1843 stop:2787 length:945 start_codon:yes stop_codon:yes gene_type:complete
MAGPLAFLPYALAAYGGYQGYQGAKQAGASGIGRLLAGATGAFTGYNLGQAGGFAKDAGFKPFTETQIAERFNLGIPRKNLNDYDPARPKGSSLTDLLLRRKGEGGTMEYDPLKISALAAGVPLALGAFNPGPVDIYQPTYNVGYAELAAQRPGYKYIDPTTGQEKEYEKVYIPEADPKNKGDYQLGPFAMNKTRLRTGGLAEIKKFNEGGINYLPSKTTHDENDANNYIRASGYVEDGAGVGDKDEDTMLAQLADGEFVTRADGVLGAGIIAGGNPNSMKDMREKGAQYFYEQQKRYKRVFDLLKGANGDSKN